MWNLTILCSAHHQSLHEGLLTIRGTAPHALEFTWNSVSASPLGQVDDAVSGRAMHSAIEAKPRSSSESRSATGIVHACDIETKPQSSGESRSATGIVHASTIEAKPQSPCANRLATGGMLEAVVDRTRTALIDEDARTALVTAGYKPREARAAVENARPHVGASATLEQVIREALRQCSSARMPASKPPNSFDNAGVSALGS